MGNVCDLTPPVDSYQRLILRSDPIHPRAYAHHWPPKDGYLFRPAAEAERNRCIRLGHHPHYPPMAANRLPN